MGRFGSAVVVGVVALFVSAPALSQTPIAGGLTALPSTSYGPNLVQNPGFETLSGALPASWTSGGGWSADQLLVHGGRMAYRRTTGASTSAQTLQLKAGIYLLSAWIKTDTLGSGATSGVRLTLDFRPGGINAWWPSDVINGTTDWKLYQIGPIVVDTDRTAAVQLENYNAASGTAWFDDVSLIQVLPAAVDAFLLYPNYRGMIFDDQPQTVQLDVTVTPPGGDFGRYSVRATLADEASGQLVAQQSFPAASHLVAAVDGSAMQSGRGYLATVSLVDLSVPDGAPNSIVSTYPAYRVSKVAGSARQSMNVSVDAKNRIVLKGVPRFVLGVYDSGLGYSSDPTFWENTLWSPTGDRRMTGLGINMYLNYHYGQAPTTAMTVLMNNLQQHGVMYLQTGNCFDKYPADPTFPINSSDSYVATLGAHAGSAGYYTIDECLSSLQAGALAQYQRLRSLDADSMTFGPLLGNPDIVLWRDSADVLGSDPYPLFGAEPSGGYNLAQVADWTALTRTAVKDARPFMTVLQFFKFTSQGRFPTLAEMRNMAYMAIVEGARGLWWWSLGTSALQDVCAGWCAEKTTYMNNLKSVVNEIAALEPALLADDAPGVLTANSNAAAIKTKVKVVGATRYVFAYNYTRTLQSATFTLSAAAASITVNAEGRTISPTGATFTDTFGPFAAHVYVVANGGADNTTLNATPTAVTAGSAVTATWSGMGVITPTDWLGLYASGTPAAAYLAWVYVSCSQTPDIGRAAGSCALRVPAGVPPAAYELRLFANNGYTRVATSGPVSVNAATVLLSESPTSAVAGAIVTAQWSGIASPTASDWIGLYAAGAPDSAYLAWVYVSCSQSAGNAATAGSCAFRLPATLTPGNYELRAFANDAFVRIATSGLFAVGAPAASLSESPASALGGAPITASWSSIGSPTATDWIGLFVPGTADTAYLAWIYVSCSQTALAAAASGSCGFAVPTTLAGGTYELRVFAANGFTRLAISNTFSVSR